MSLQVVFELFSGTASAKAVTFHNISSVSRVSATRRTGAHNQSAPRRLKDRPKAEYPRRISTFQPHAAIFTKHMSWDFLAPLRLFSTIVFGDPHSKFSAPSVVVSAASCRLVPSDIAGRRLVNCLLQLRPSLCDVFTWPHPGQNCHNVYSMARKRRSFCKNNMLRHRAHHR